MSLVTKTVSVIIACAAGTCAAQNVQGGSIPVGPPPPAQPAAMQYAAPSVTGSPTTTQQSGGRQAQQQAPVPVQLPSQGLPKEIFNQVLQGQIPLSQEQVKTLHKAEDNIKKAHATRTATMPKPISRTVPISLASGGTPHIIRLAVDFTSTLVFTDSSGSAWPVRRLIIGNKEQVTVPELEGAVGAALKAPTNIVTLVPMEDYVSTNATVLLEGAPAPIILMLATGQPQYDARVDLPVMGRGPNSAAPSFESSVGNTVLGPEFSSLLDGIVPSGAIQLKSDSDSLDGWLISGRMYVRSKLNLLSPMALRQGRSADGMTVYETSQSSLVRLMNNGQVLSVHLTGFPPPTLEVTRKSMTSK